MNDRIQLVAQICAAFGVGLAKKPVMELNLDVEHLKEVLR
jgi:hypothetical protein